MERLMGTGATRSVAAAPSKSPVGIDDPMATEKQSKPPKAVMNLMDFESTTF